MHAYCVPCCPNTHAAAKPGQLQSQGSICVPLQHLAHACCRNNTEFLPAALVIGLQPGVPLVVPIVVVAEDGVTSQRYYIAGTSFSPVRV